MEEIITSPNDKCEYKTYKLENGMRVFLIRDYISHKCAVAMSVNVGFMNDKIYGTAHLLEHMLFLGTKKYPDDSSFQLFVSHNGGSYNAYTSHNNTCYHFTVNNDSFEEAMERFSDFFVDPLLSEKSIIKEIRAVNAEHEKNINNDVFRTLHILKLDCYNDHGFHNFSTGNNDTLKVDGISSEIRQFYESSYSSDNMTLVVLTTEQLDNAKKLIDKLFSNVKKKNIIVNNRQTGKILEKFNIINIKPRMNKNILEIYWDVEYNNDYYSTSTNLICSLLGNEEEGSIFYALMNKGYIYSLNCEALHVNDRRLIEIDIELTEHGIEHENEIIGCVKQYINMLKIKYEKLDTYYNELTTIDMNNFTIARKNNPEISIFRILNAYLKGVDPKHVMSYVTHSKKYNDIIDDLNKILNTMDNFTVIRSYINNNPIENTEPYYGISYSFDKLDVTATESFILDIPPKNIYIPKSIDVLSGKLSEYPIRIINEDNFISFWKLDTRFNTPITNVIVKIYLKELIKSEEITKYELIKKCVCIKMLLKCLLYDFTTNIYMCKQTNCNFSIHLKYNSYIEIDITCYSDVIHLVIELIKKMLLTHDISENALNIVKTLATDHYTNVKNYSPYEKCFYLFNKNIIRFEFDYKDALKVIDKISINDVNTVSFSDSYIVMFICGNTTIEDATNISMLFTKEIISLNSSKEIMPFKPTLTDMDIFKESYSKIIEEDSENDYEHNSAIYCCIPLAKYRIGVNDWNIVHCSAKVFDAIVKELYFNTMRTTKGYGYIVKSSTTEYGNVIIILFYYFIVQTPSKEKLQQIKQDDYEFIKSCKKFIEDVDDKTFETIINSLIKPLTCEFENEDEVVNYYMYQIDAKYYKYDYKEILIDTYKNTTKKDILTFYDKYFNTDPMFVSVIGNKH